MRPFVARRIIMRQIVPILIVPIVIAANLIVPQMIVQRRIIPVLFNPQNINGSASHLDAVRNLVGEWTGSATFRDSMILRNIRTGNNDGPDPAYCMMTYNVTLNIQNSTADSIAGQFIIRQTKGEPSDAYKALNPAADICDRNENFTLNFNAGLSSSRIQTFNLPEGVRQIMLAGAPTNTRYGYGSFQGSYTTDTITLTQTAMDENDSFQGRQLQHPINLLRQHTLD